MALVTGYLRQTCTWTPRTAEFDAFGQPAAPASQTIRCRWTKRSGWARGQMGDSSTAAQSSYQSIVMVDAQVNEGDTLTIEIGSQTVGGVVKAVETIVDLAGKEQGRTCYV